MQDHKKNIHQWREYIACKKTNISSSIFLDFQISNDELTIYDVPDPKAPYMDQLELIERINWFALTYNAYNDKETQEIQNAVSEWSEKKNLEQEYFDERKHKDSLRYLRAILFYCQRTEHMSGPHPDYEIRIKQIISDIRNLLKK